MFPYKFLADGIMSKTNLTKKEFNKRKEFQQILVCVEGTKTRAKEVLCV